LAKYKCFKVVLVISYKQNASEKFRKNLLTIRAVIKKNVCGIWGLLQLLVIS